MKRMKFTPIQLAAVLLVLCSLTVGVYSYMFKQTNKISNEFIPAIVSCEVFEETDKTETQPLTQKEEITVQNTGNIDSYIRVRLVTYWVDGSNNIVAKPSTMPSIPYDANYWVEDEDNDTYYYKTKVSPTSSTHDLLEGSKTIQLEAVDANGYHQVIDVFAEAIQAEPKGAVEAAWPVKVTIVDEIPTISLK